MKYRHPAINMIYYFAYGSNLHPLRMKERVPSAELQSSASISGFRLVFNKTGVDGSAKCNLEETTDPAATVYGAIYKIKKEHKPILDKFESLNKGYVDTVIRVEIGGKLVNCFTYVAQKEYIDNELKPFHWYKRLVILGATYLNFPVDYIKMVESVESVEDNNMKRRQEHEQLIEQMKRLQPTCH